MNKHLQVFLKTYGRLSEQIRPDGEPYCAVGDPVMCGGVGCVCELRLGRCPSHEAKEHALVPKEYTLVRRALDTFLKHLLLLVLRARQAQSVLIPPGGWGGETNT